jgi:hypothetical protein
MLAIAAKFHGEGHYFHCETSRMVETMNATSERILRINTEAGIEGQSWKASRVAGTILEVAISATFTKLRKVAYVVIGLQSVNLSTVRAAVA